MNALVGEYAKISLMLHTVQTRTNDLPADYDKSTPMLSWSLTENHPPNRP
jgi:hypothetical protein